MGKKKEAKKAAKVAAKVATARTTAAYGRALAVMRYDGATRGHRASGWRAVVGDPNQDILLDGPRLRHVSRDMIQNNSQAVRGLQIVDQNVIGSGIEWSVKTKSQKRKDDIKSVLDAHLGTTACDVEGLSDFRGIQSLVTRSVVADGECFVVRYISNDERAPLRFKMHVTSTDYLDTSKDGPESDGSYNMQGIKFAKTGERLGYWLYDQHPNNQRLSTIAKSTFFNASDVIHCFRRDWAGQQRGVTWFAPVILKMHDSADFKDAQLIRQKLAACFVGVITTDKDMNAPIVTDGEGNVVEARTGHQIETMSPGMFEYAEPGQSVTFNDPPQVGDFSPYMKATDKDIAAGLGISYESFTGDYSDVNFSSARMGWLEMARSIDKWRWQMIIPQLCERVGAWCLEMAGIMLPANKPAKTAVEWTPPAREMISPREEVPMLRDMIRAGLMSWPEAVRSLGRNPQDILDETAEWQAQFDKNGIKFDSDGRWPATAPLGGEPQANDNQPENTRKKK